MKRDLKIRYYGRYVDDFVLVHESREYLEACIPKIARFLRTELDLELHPKKISLQPVRRGVKFLGVFIKPNRRHIGNRTKGNFHACVVNIATGIGSDFRPGKAETAEILSRINSYLGLLAAHDTYKLRKKTLSLLPEAFWECFVVSGDYSCIRKRANDLENMIG